MRASLFEKLLTVSIKPLHPQITSTQLVPSIMLSTQCTSFSLLLFVSFLAPLVASTNQSLEGQLAGLAADVQNILKTDRVLRGQKVRLDKVSSSGIPDSNYDQFIEQSLQKQLADVFDKSAKLILKVEYSYLESDGSSPILVGRFENTVDSVSFWDERINH